MACTFDLIERANFPPRGCSSTGGEKTRLITSLGNEAFNCAAEFPEDTSIEMYTNGSEKLGESFVVGRDRGPGLPDSCKSWSFSSGCGFFLLTNMSNLAVPAAYFNIILHGGLIPRHEILQKTGTY